MGILKIVPRNSHCSQAQGLWHSYHLLVQIALFVGHLQHCYEQAAPICHQNEMGCEPFSYFSANLSYKWNWDQLYFSSTPLETQNELGLPMVLSASNAFQVASEETESSQIALLSWVFPVILQEIPTGPPAIPINGAKKKKKTELFANKSPVKPPLSGKRLPADEMLARRLSPGAASSELAGELWKAESLSLHLSTMRICVCYTERKLRQESKEEPSSTMKVSLRKQLLAGLHLCLRQTRGMRFMLWRGD